METTLNDFQHEIISIIENNIDYPNLTDLLEQYHPYDLSRAMIAIEDEQKKTVLLKLKKNLLSEIFEYFSVTEFQNFVEYFDQKTMAKIIEDMDLDLSVDFIKSLGSYGHELLKNIEVNKRKRILEMMQYHPDEIGSYLNDSYLKIDLNFSVKQAMKYITEHAYQIDYISIIYITKQEQLVGYIKLKELITARANDLIEDIMEIRFPRVYVDDDVEYVAKLMQETKDSAIPIIDDHDHILGVVTHDDLLDIIALAEEEDYTKFAGLSDYDRELDQLSIFKSVKSRLPWLSILLFLSMGTSMILSVFDSMLASSGPLLAARLAVFLPLILDMAGNTGTQSLAVTIRYLSKNERIESAILRGMIYRELKTGLIQGVMIGIVVFGMILLSQYTSKDTLTQLDMIYGLVTAASVFVALLVSTTLGGLIPMMMHRINIDPAVASGPFITTISDIITLSIYYAIGMSILLPLYT